MNKLLLIIIFSTLPLISQNEISTSQKFDNSFELKLGDEIYRHLIAGGIVYNLNASKHFTFSAGIEFIGIPVATGSFKFPFKFSRFSFYPKVGLGLLPVGYLITSSGNLGFGLKYKISPKFNLLLEFNQHFIAGQIISIGPGNFSRKSIKDYPPLTLLIGIEIY